MRNGLAALCGFGLLVIGVLPAMAAAKVAAPKAASTPKLPVGAVRMPVLSYTVDKAGPAAGEHPKRSDMITVNYRLTLLDGTEVDGSAKRGKPDVFPLNRLIPAWQILLQKMRPGDAWTFYVPPEYAYGANAKDGLPANSFLIFKVELIAFAPPPPESK
jgi:FKBP-type peptidyl-prolyl cis-trans isomerase